jgi:nucleotide-binding universal stress UspA family protein
MFTKLLVPLDGSALAEQALGPAAAIARATRASVELVLVHQPAAFADFVDAAWQTNPSKAEREYIASTAHALAKGASVVASGVALRGTTSDTIGERVEQTGADLIVMTSHGRTGLSRAWLGSIAHEILRRSPTPVLMLRPTEAVKVRPLGEKRFKKVLVTLDGSALSEAILAPATDLARAFDARLMLLRVVEPVPMVLPEATLPVRSLPRDDAATAEAVETATSELAAIGKRITDETGIRVEMHVVVGERVAKAILEFARSVSPSIIAMSTHGRGASRLFLGSVADKVLRASNTPLLLSRPSTVREEPRLIDAACVEEQLPALSIV